MDAVIAMLLAATASGGASPTDFGVRQLGVPAASAAPAAPAAPERVTLRPLSGRIDIGAVALIAARWGRVTSTVRTPERNRQVGGVPNSHHLHGRAIDIVRRPGVTHAQIEAALRGRGYHLVESLDEGDHSHFAFGWPSRPTQARLTPGASGGEARPDRTLWRIVSPPR